MSDMTLAPTSRTQDNPLLRLGRLGQSIWLDFISRGMLNGGQLRDLIEQDGLSGVTANPTIFENAITGSHDYDTAVRSMVLKNMGPQSMYETLAIEDVQAAADLLRPVYDQRGGGDGFVSLEVSPQLAHDTDGTLAEARRFWRALGRPNVMIKVPGTREGLPAIRQLTAEGINVNVTLLFGLSRYRQAAEAYIAGLEERAAAGQPLDTIRSVASFFLSRIDVLVDPMLEQQMRGGGAAAELAAALHGQTAVASAKLAYQLFREIFQGEGFRALAASGAHPQRVLWASTGTKNPAYPDLKYVEPLIGPDTVNTLPLETLLAYRDHGKAESTLEADVAAAVQVFQRLPEAGIDIERVSQQLENEGVRKFVEALDRLLKALQEHADGTTL